MLCRTAINVSTALLVLPVGNLLSTPPFLFHLGLVWLAYLVLTLTARFGRQVPPSGAANVVARPDGTEAAP